MTSTMLLQAANNVYACEDYFYSVGGMPIYGIKPEWFVDQFLKFVDLKPEAAGWAQPEVEQTMAALWVLDPEDLI
jgi:hypothetical protein